MVYSCFFLNVSNVCVRTETESRNYCTNRHGLIYQVINRWDMGGGGGTSALGDYHINIC